MHFEEVYNRILTSRRFILYFVLLMKSHLQSYPCPLQINSFWNLGFLLGIAIILQIITGIFLVFSFIIFICLSLSISTSWKSYILWFILL